MTIHQPKERPFRPWIFMILLLCALFGTSCSTKVYLTNTGANLFSRPVDVAATKSSWSKISSGKACGQDIVDYNDNTLQAVSQIIRINPSLQSEVPLYTTDDQEITATIDSSRIWGFKRTDQWLLAENVTIEDGLRRRISQGGVGVPMLVRLQRNEHIDPLIPDSGMWLPTTAMLVPNSNGGMAIRLVDTTAPSGRRIGNKPIAHDFSAAIARDFFDRQRQFREVKALIHYDKFEPYMGIKRMFNFDPSKRALVLVHGVFSSPTTWAQMINRLMEDPVIRENYEFWTFAFPTGAPIPYLSNELRNALQEMQTYRLANGAQHPEVTLIGHSMGGLMAKAVTQYGGDEQWDRYFDVPPDQLNVSSTDRDTLRDMFYFEPVPFVNQVIFAATPHGGTTTATKPIANLASRLARAPLELVRATEQVLINGGNQALTPQGFQLNLEFPNSIEHMRIGSDIGEIFCDIPLTPGIRYHSIIGSEKGVHVPKTEITDGVVTYQSAYVHGVESEKIVESDHGVHRAEGGIAEITRILKSAL